MYSLFCWTRRKSDYSLPISGVPESYPKALHQQAGNDAIGSSVVEANCNLPFFNVDDYSPSFKVEGNSSFPFKGNTASFSIEGAMNSSLLSVFSFTTDVVSMVFTESIS